jgi:8-oxo-dGTP pyrophosphatase MutT (NUDIX family)
MAVRLEEAPARREASRVSVVRAAGGVPVREGAGSLEVLVVHRPAYGDWSFPKGKCDPGESDEACAAREVEEETGLVCALEDELPSTSYVDGKGRPKRVRYWRLRVVGGEARFDHEVDDARWVSVEEAVALLTYERDVEVLRALGSVTAGD